MAKSPFFKNRQNPTYAEVTEYSKGAKPKEPPKENKTEKMHDMREKHAARMPRQRIAWRSRGMK